jgi:hypothetical protein
MKEMEVRKMDIKNVTKDMDWSGWLVRPKAEWLNPGEDAKPYVVIEDRGPRVLIQLLPQYQPENMVFPVMESGLKDWYEVIDTEIQNYENA